MFKYLWEFVQYFGTKLHRFTLENGNAPPPHAFFPVCQPRIPMSICIRGIHYVYSKIQPKLLTAHIYFVFQINPYSLKYVVSPTAPPTIYVLVQCIAIHREHCDYVFLSTCINISETSVEIITANWLTTVSIEGLLNAFQPFYLLKLYEWFGMVALLMKIFFVFLFFFLIMTLWLWRFKHYICISAFFQETMLH